MLPLLYDLMTNFFLSFSIYCQTLFRVLSAGVLCTLRVTGWKPTSNHIEITVGFSYLHRGWLSLHRGHPVNVPIRRTMHLSSVIPANDTRESVLGHLWNLYLYICINKCMIMDCLWTSLWVTVHYGWLWHLEWSNINKGVNLTNILRIMALKCNN